MLVGYALLTDDALTTLSSLAVTDEQVRSSSEPDLLFQPTEWELDPAPDGFVEAVKVLRRLAHSAKDLREHVDSSFSVLVRALADARKKKLFGEDVFMSVLSTDPSEYLEELEVNAIQEINNARIVRLHREFMDRWR